MLIAFKWCSYVMSVILCLAIGNAIVSGRMVRRTGSDLSYHLPTHQRYASQIIRIVILMVLIVEGFGAFLPQIHQRSNLFWFAHVPCIVIFMGTLIPISLGVNGKKPSRRKLHRRLGYACGYAGLGVAFFGSLIAFLK